MTRDEGNRVLYNQAFEEKNNLMNNVKVCNTTYRKDYGTIKKKIGEENVIFDK